MSKLSDKALLALAPFFGSLAMKLLRLTLRIKVVDAPALGRGEKAIYTFWHGRMLMMPFLKPEGPFSVLVSRHKDGELISRVMGYFGIETSRGSTTRGGSAGLKDIIKRARKGYNLAFTPDGPRGPRYVVQMGAIHAARATGLPIYPATYSARKKKLLIPGTAS